MKGIVIDKTPYDYYIEMPDGSIHNTIGTINSQVGDSISMSIEYSSPTSNSSHIKFNNNLDYF